VKQKTIIVTGGLGYIGSHTIACLADNGWRIHVIDNLSTSNLNVLSDLKILTGHDIGFDQLDVRDTDALSAAFKTIMPDAIIHFAGLKVADESLRKPLDYYSHNVAGALSVLSAMKQLPSIGVFIFSGRIWRSRTLSYFRDRSICSRHTLWPE